MKVSFSSYQNKFPLAFFKIYDYDYDVFGCSKGPSALALM